MAKTINDLNIEVPLDVRIEVSVQAYFLHLRGGSFLMPADETSEKYKMVAEKNSEILKEARPVIDLVLQKIKEWEEDGRPE